MTGKDIKENIKVINEKNLYSNVIYQELSVGKDYIVKI